MNKLKQKAKQLRQILENVASADAYIGMTKEEMIENNILNTLEHTEFHATLDEKTRIIKLVEEYAKNRGDAPGEFMKEVVAKNMIKAINND